jgi:hypothetical protein
MKWWMRVGLRWWLFIAYCVILSVGTYFLARDSGSHPTGLVAARELPANRLLLAGDFEPVAGAGQYLTRAVKPHEPIKPGDLSAFPTLTLAAGELPLAFPVARAAVISGAVNAGEKVRICKGDDSIVSDVPVRAVLCPPAQGQCIAIAVLATPKGDDISKAFAKDSPPRLQPVATRPACKVSP